MPWPWTYLCGSTLCYVDPRASRGLASDRFLLWIGQVGQAVVRPDMRAGFYDKATERTIYPITNASSDGPSDDTRPTRGV